MTLPDGFIYTYLLLPFLIIVARIVDVSLGTLKIIFMTRGNIAIVPALAFFEVLVWLLAVTRIFENLDNWICYLAYAFGFALGSYIGIKIEEKLAIGVQLIRIITRKDANILIDRLRESGYTITSIEAEGNQGKVGILYSVIKRKSIADFVKIIKNLNPNAFYTIEDIRFVSQSLLSNNTEIRTKKRFITMKQK